MPKWPFARTQVAVLQPFLKRAGRPLPGSAEQVKATPTYSDAVSKLEEAVALVDTLGCEVVFKEVNEGEAKDSHSGCCFNLFRIFLCRIAYATYNSHDYVHMVQI